MNKESLEHYYGDRIRTLFVVGGLIMAVSYPFFHSLIHNLLALSIIGSIVLSVVGGLMNPLQKWVIFLSTIISIVAFISFEYYAIYAYINLPPTQELHVAFFWTNQVLAVIFFLAAYLSTKTLRGALLAGKE